MGTHDDLIDRLTSRLRVDPELRADVAAELRAHLEDAAAEYVRGGYSDQAAAAQAVRALGDEADLARQLWQANRRRIALRRVCRWAARVLLVPGAVAVIVLVAWGLRGQRQFGSFVGSRLLSDDVVERMTGDERLIVLGDTGADTYVRAQRAIVDRWPDNPIYRANYVAAYLAARVRRLPRYTSGGIGPAGGVLPVWEERTPLDDVATDDPAALLAEVVAELDRAAAADPDNALYPLLRAALRVQASSEARQDGAGPEGEPLRPGVLIGDEAVFARALEDTRLAAARPHYAAHEADLARIRLEAIPKSRRLMDAVTLPLAVGNRAAQVWVATYGLQRNWARTLAAYARQLAAEGRRDEALQLNRQLRTIAAKRGAGSQTIIESLLATALYALALHNEADIHEALGQGERAEAIRQRNERVFELHKSFLLNRTMDTEATRARSTYQYLQHTNYVDPAPMRAAEYALIEQAALVGLLTAVLIVALLAVLCTGISLLRRRTARPYLLFVGWGPIGRICLLAIVMPLAVYVLYTRLAPFSSQRFGWWYAEDRIALELVTLGLVIVGLLVGLTYRAVRRRAAEAGLEVPRPLRRPDRRVFVTIAALLGAVIIVYLAAWEIVHLVPRWTEWVNTWELQHYPGWYIAGAAVLVAAVWFIREAVYVLRLRGNLAAFRRTLIRSSIGVYAAAIILVGAICGVTLRRVEAVHVSHLTGNAYVGIDNELELSSLRDLRAWFIQHHQELTAADE